jgi:hypothetical protein
MKLLVIYLSEQDMEISGKHPTGDIEISRLEICA